MTPLLVLFWRICSLKTGPESVPTSVLLLGLIIVANTLVSILVSTVIATAVLAADPTLLEQNPDLATHDAYSTAVLFQTLTQVIVSQATVAGTIFLFLNLMGHANRFPRTITAIFGADLFITSVSGVIIFLAFAINPAMASIIVTLLMFWSLTVIGFILHKALGVHIGFGIAISLFVVIFSLALSTWAVI
ncbi:MAG: hypothetical protein GXP16_02720 [Gammaproteobacteria bacterium]|nr:hypothetical protein [Gammaproteobacteria bacterium]